MGRSSVVLVTLLLAQACGQGATPTTTTPAALPPPADATTVAPAPTTVPPVETTEVSPTTTVAAVAQRDVTFVTSDDFTLEGTVFDGGPDWVILAHMFPSTQTGWFGFARNAARDGFTALTFNFRGYGNSDGPKEPFRVDVDVVAAIDFAESQGAQRVWLIGASMGGAGSLAAAPDRTSVVGVATLSAPTGWMGTDALGAVPQITVPKLFIAAEGDGGFAASVSEFVAASAEPVDSKMFTGSRHGTELFAEHGEELTALLLDFLMSPR
ncbi:MAG: alpha/beta hydrolase [Acidimicrobiia bacterium]